MRAASNDYLKIAGPFYAFFGLALCLYFASLGAGRVLWPVIAAILRVVVVLGGGLILLETEVRTTDFFWLIAAGMVTQAIVTGAGHSVRSLTRGLDKESDSEEQT